MTLDIENTLVIKFGGTSVGSSERIGNAAKRVAKLVRSGKRVVVVVSAMSGETDRLVDLAKKVYGALHTGREYHQLVSSGEQVTVALMSMALLREGIRAKSLLAHQVGLKTRQVLGQHLIQSVNAELLRDLLLADTVPVIAGFQGVDDDGSYSTLGRGGSDTTAVAISASFASLGYKPCRCEILTDVDGVYTALPAVCKRARKLKHLTYEEMLEMASSGAKVLQSRSVSLAHKHRVPLIVASSFNENEGTEIVENYEGMENAVVSGITCRTDEVKLTLRNLPDRPGVAAMLCKSLGDAEVVIDMIVQSQGSGEKTTLSFTVPKEDEKRAYDALLEVINKNICEASLEVDRDIAKLSLVGEGMRTHAGVASKMFEVLGSHGINIEMITTSEIKISVAIPEKYAELAVRVLHEAFIEAE